LIDAAERELDGEYAGGLAILAEDQRRNETGRNTTRRVVGRIVRERVFARLG